MPDRTSDPPARGPTAGLPPAAEKDDTRTDADRVTPHLSDHFSFLTQVPVPFSYDGRQSLQPMYGPVGLSRILRTATEACGSDQVSFTLEIHQVEGRLPLADAARLFRHWTDLTKAERMNYWLSVLAENSVLATSGLQLAEREQLLGEVAST